jgi:DNA-binding response OmpR family regulator
MQKVVKILLIEDDKIDQVQVKHVLDKKGILYRMRIDVNSKDALNFLENDNHTEFDGHPDIILLDIDLRRTNGVEFLSEFRKKGKWNGIKLFVLSNSDEERVRMYEIGVAGYIIKPLKLRNPSRDTISFLIDLMNICEWREP